MQFVQQCFIQPPLLRLSHSFFPSGTEIGQLNKLDKAAPQRDRMTITIMFKMLRNHFIFRVQ